MTKARALGVIIRGGPQYRLHNIESKIVTPEECANICPLLRVDDLVVSACLMLRIVLLHLGLYS